MKRDVSILKKRIIAHRGIHNEKIKENTLLAFKKSIDLGFDIELDVRLSSDKKIVVFHDECLDRVYGIDKLVKDVNYVELKKIGICGLDDVFKLVRGRVNLIIEIKKESNDFELEKILVKLLDNYDGGFAVQSFNIKTIMWFKKYRNDYLRGLLISNSTIRRKKILYRFIKFFKLVDFLSCNYRLYNDKIIRRKNDVIVIGWTINNYDDYNYYREYFDNLICDNLEVYYEE